MPDYSKSKVYKMECCGLTYIGSTTEPTVAHRLASHKRDYKRWGLGKAPYVSSYKLFELGEPIIVLLESVNCNNRDELHRRERFYIETMECVNKCIPTRTKKEYYQDNSGNILEKKHQYYEANIDKIKEYNQEYYQANAVKKREYQRQYYLKKK